MITREGGDPKGPPMSTFRKGKETQMVDGPKGPIRVARRQCTVTKTGLPNNGLGNIRESGPHRRTKTRGEHKRTKRRAEKVNWCPSTGPSSTTRDPGVALATPSDQRALSFRQEYGGISVRHLWPGRDQIVRLMERHIVMSRRQLVQIGPRFPGRRTGKHSQRARTAASAYLESGAPQ